MVLFYQVFWFLVVFLSTSFWGKKAGLVVSIFVSIFTLTHLFFPPLMIIQLCVVWGTYLFASSNLKTVQSDNEAELTDYENVINKNDILSEQNISYRNKDKTISNREHYQELIHAIENAQRELYILSGWISNNVVDEAFLQKVEKLLRRGVKLKVAYGWENYNGKHVFLKNSEGAINSLEKLSNKYSHNFKLCKYANHSKLLIKDDEYFIIGSYNWLSNKTCTNKEISMLSYNRRLLQRHKAELMELFS